MQILYISNIHRGFISKKVEGEVQSLSKIPRANSSISKSQQPLYPHPHYPPFIHREANHLFSTVHIQSSFPTLSTFLLIVLLHHPLPFSRTSSSSSFITWFHIASSFFAKAFSGCWFLSPDLRLPVYSFISPPLFLLTTIISHLSLSLSEKSLLYIEQLALGCESSSILDLS